MLASINENPSATSGASRPDGSGRRAVRLISPSKSRSAYMLRALAAATTSAVAPSAINKRATGKLPPATSAPHVAVTITSARMLGFESSTSAPKVPSRKPEPRNDRVEAVVRDMGCSHAASGLCAVARLTDRARRLASRSLPDN
jgi:hypothetical protein